MALGGITFIAIILGAIAIGLIGFMFKRLFGNRNRGKNEDIIINLLSDYTDGHGVLLKKEERIIGDRVAIKGTPRDMDYIGLDDDKPEPKEQNLFVKKNLLIPLANSRHRKVYMALPNTAEELPEEFKESEFGKVLMKHVENQGSKEDLVEVYRIRQENILEAVKKDEGMDAVKGIVDLYGDHARNLIKLTHPMEDKGKSQTN